MRQCAALPWLPRRVATNCTSKRSIKLPLNRTHQPLVSKQSTIVAADLTSTLRCPGLDPLPAYYNNRAAALIMLMDYEAALQDAKQALSKDSENPKVSLSLSMANIHLTDYVYVHSTIFARPRAICRLDALRMPSAIMIAS